MFKKIKKCHNCKSKPTLIYTEFSDKDIRFRMVCKNCGLKQFGYFDSKKEAIDSWNKKTNPSSLWDEPHRIETNLIKINNMKNKRGD